jgi:hypothetical protein
MIAALYGVGPVSDHDCSEPSGAVAASDAFSRMFARTPDQKSSLGLTFKPSPAFDVPASAARTKRVTQRACFIEGSFVRVA